MRWNHILTRGLRLDSWGVVPEPGVVLSVYVCTGFRAVECLTEPSQSGDVNAAFFGEKGVAVLVLATIRHYTTPEHRDLSYQGLKGRYDSLIHSPTYNVV
jgi:hypothetical protein